MKPLLHGYDIADEVTAFSTTRKGGVSKGKYGEFNINSFCGDNATDIDVNRHLLAKALGIDPLKIIVPHQVHGTETCNVDESLLALSQQDREVAIDGYDAVMTNLAGVCIGVSTADCIPVLVYDSEHHAAAAIHAGWRGTVKRIVVRTIEDMQQTYNSNPGKLKAVVGPGISLKNFEVGDEVYDEFYKAGFDMTTIAHRYEKWHIDLPECNRIQLVEAGLDDANIQMSGICTYDSVAEYFSARRLGIDSGRIYTALMMK